MTANSDVRNAHLLSFTLSVPVNSPEEIRKTFSILHPKCEIEFACYHNYHNYHGTFGAAFGDFNNDSLYIKIIGKSSNSPLAQMFGIITCTRITQLKETVVRVKSLRQVPTFQIDSNSAANPTVVAQSKETVIRVKSLRQVETFQIDSNSAANPTVVAINPTLTPQVKCDFVIWGLPSNGEMPKTETLQSLVLKDFEKMYSEGLEHDVCFDVGEKTLRAHRAVLSARSPVFQKMFEVEMSEKASGRVPISDCSPEAFDCFLRFLYCGDVTSEDLGVLLAVYGAADKYSVPELKQRCADIMRTTLTVQGACVVLAHALLHQDKVTEKSARDFIVSHFTEVAWQPTWSDFIVQHMEIAKELSQSVKI